MGCACAEKIARGAIGLAKAAARIDRADESTISTRRDRCRNCPHATRNVDRINEPSKGLTTFSRCELCGCVIVAKTAIASERCPDNPPRW